jgi:hypothetical protein
VPVVQQRREQRRRALDAAAALRLRQRGLLMLEQLQQFRMHLLHQPLRTLIPQSHSQRQRVDEQAQHVLRAFAHLQQP